MIRVMVVHRYTKIWSLNHKGNINTSKLSSILIHEHENIACMGSVQFLLQDFREKSRTVFPVFERPDLEPRKWKS